MLSTVTNLYPIFAKAMSWQAVLIAIIAAIIVLAVWAVILLILWNLVFPGLFGWPCISFFQALGLGLFIAVLF